jgi:uncharacterized protein YyaL (SSP411 family)
MHRSKPLADEAMPSGNGIAAFALQRLGYLLGKSRYLKAAEGVLRNAWQSMTECPQGHVSLITALEEYLKPPEIVIIRGQAEEINHSRNMTAKIYAPRRLIFAIGADTENLPGELAKKHAIDGQTMIYQCSGSHCSLSTGNPNTFIEELNNTE